MTEKQPTTANQTTAERNEALREQWSSSELPANTPVTISAEHTTADAPEVAAFHLGGEDSYDDRRKRGALYQVIDTSKLERTGNYYTYDGYSYDARQGGDYLIVSSPGDGSELRRSDKTGKPDNFHYMFLSKGGQLRLGRESDNDLTPDTNTISRQHLELDIDQDGNLSFIDLNSTNGTTLHAPEEAVMVTGESIEGHTEPDTDDTEEDPSVAIDAEPDAEIRHSDAELLGRRYPVRQAVRAVGNQRVRAIESAQATWKNTLDTPKKMRLGLRTSLAEGRVARHQARVAAATEGTWVHQRRTRKLEKVTAKRDRIKSDYDAVTGRMKDRRTSVKDNFEKRKGDYVKELKDRAELARSRKALRHELKDQGAGFVERRKIVKDVIKNHPDVILEAIGDTSSVAAINARELKKAEKSEERIHKMHTQTKETLSATSKQAKEYASKLHTASERQASLTDATTSTSEKIEALTAERESLDERDPRYFVAGIELREAERTLEALTAEAENLDQNITFLTNEVDRLNAEQTRLTDKAQVEQSAHDTAKQHTATRRQAAEDARIAQQKAAHDAVASQLPPTKEKK